MALRRSFWSLATEAQSYKTILRFSKSPLFVYQQVTDIDKYSQFLRWCTSSKVLIRRGDYCEAELTIGFPPLSQSYISQVYLKSPTSVVSKSPKNAVFDVLESSWDLRPPAAALKSSEDRVEVTECEAHYSITFQFASPIYSSLSRLVFDMVCVETSKAFLKRIEAMPGNQKCTYSPKLRKYVE
jgi:coenzyme Q-binding protein COQ10